jgi:hypothetical protein
VSILLWPLRNLTPLRVWSILLWPLRNLIMTPLRVWSILLWPLFVTKNLITRSRGRTGTPYSKQWLRSWLVVGGRVERTLPGRSCHLEALTAESLDRK